MTDPTVHQSKRLAEKPSGLIYHHKTDQCPMQEANDLRATLGEAFFGDGCLDFEDLAAAVVTSFDGGCQDSNSYVAATSTTQGW